MTKEEVMAKLTTEYFKCGHDKKKSFRKPNGAWVCITCFMKLMSGTMVTSEEFQGRLRNTEKEG